MAYTAATKHRNAQRMGGGEIVAFPMKASAVIYEGSMVLIDITDGYAVELPIDTTADTGDLFAGIAAETKTAPAAGVVYINVYVTGSFVMSFLNGTDTIAQTDLGTAVYADYTAGGTGRPWTVCKTGASAHDLLVGRIVEIIGTGVATTERAVRIRIDGYAGCQAAAAGA